MTKKLFLIYKIVAVIVLAVVINVSVNNGNWYLPVTLLVTIWVSLYVLRKRVNEVMADERDYKIGGRAATLAIGVYTLFSAVAGLGLYIAEKENEVLFAVGSVLLYSACFLMLVYAISFKIYERKSEHN